MKLTLHEIAKVVGAKNDVTAYDDVAINQIEFDSRKITAGDLFLPLKGVRDLKMVLLRHSQKKTYHLTKPTS